MARTYCGIKALAHTATPSGQRRLPVSCSDVNACFSVATEVMAAGHYEHTDTRT